MGTFLLGIFLLVVNSEETFRKQKRMSIPTPRISWVFGSLWLLSQREGSWTWNGLCGATKGHPGAALKAKEEEVVKCLIQTRWPKRSGFTKSQIPPGMARQHTVPAAGCWACIKSVLCVLGSPPPRLALGLRYCPLHSNQNWGSWGKPLTRVFPQLPRSVYWRVVFFKAFNKKYTTSSVPLFF